MFSHFEIASTTNPASMTMFRAYRHYAELLSLYRRHVSTAVAAGIARASPPRMTLASEHPMNFRPVYFEQVFSESTAASASAAFLGSTGLDESGFMRSQELLLCYRQNFPSVERMFSAEHFEVRKTVAVFPSRGVQEYCARSTKVTVELMCQERWFDFFWIVSTEQASFYSSGNGLPWFHDFSAPKLAWLRHLRDYVSSQVLASRTVHAHDLVLLVTWWIAYRKHVAGLDDQLQKTERHLISAIGALNRCDQQHAASSSRSSNPDMTQDWHYTTLSSGVQRLTVELGERKAVRQRVSQDLFGYLNIRVYRLFFAYCRTHPDLTRPLLASEFTRTLLYQAHQDLVVRPALQRFSMNAAVFDASVLPSRPGTVAPTSPNRRSSFNCRHSDSDFAVASRASNTSLFLQATFSDDRTATDATMAANDMSPNLGGDGSSLTSSTTTDSDDCSVSEGKTTEEEEVAYVDLGFDMDQLAQESQEWSRQSKPVLAKKTHRSVASKPKLCTKPTTKPKTRSLVLDTLGEPRPRRLQRQPRQLTLSQESATAMTDVLPQ